ncbi:MAG: anti-sigma factor family protein [Planctomycetota bacterium]|jgi:anti-sigma factor RsiW
MAAGPLTCRELVDFLDRHLDGRLPAPEQEEFERHLAACSDCRDYVATYRDTIRLARSLCAGGDDVPRDVPEELVAAILAARTKGDE